MIEDEFIINGTNNVHIAKYHYFAMFKFLKKSPICFFVFMANPTSTTLNPFMSFVIEEDASNDEAFLPFSSNCNLLTCSRNNLISFSKPSRARDSLASFATNGLSSNLLFFTVNNFKMFSNSSV
ncbi:hypothetical protein OQL93_056 [Saccharomyces cerevisiae synthetic construct]|uniref:Putative uncharacterized protein YIL115W-A n=2 Tax=Saccharomyces cerevisiae TaxID=4932 RepID=YI115_YEAST|nr:RecName: Full=Putative uncharacterized protein YIL115W-A [Saccharomyces cerevisiae S288C]AHX39317.1 hypothetical protein YIL115W-A [Saccharomyces cerevisiae]EWG95432.1 hypothetical protein R103_I10401 [Saccharomyces cerevisiae R103]WHM58758.1 hypothetical protein OQL93_056 [Saccharomyces cerevisiae synthetic construct]CAY80392.1 EC1118_1I12_0628p [Saccharomyces cerevisiae EC1118]KZV10498.1 hypothetical protein WN66_03139 [Saccharomyces cerevisiae]